jgi:hypothetical protein
MTGVSRFNVRRCDDGGTAHSKIGVRIATRYWEDGGPADHRPWIAPSIPIELSSQEYFDNRDPVLEAVLERIRSHKP